MPGSFRSSRRRRHAALPHARWRAFGRRRTTADDSRVAAVAEAAGVVPLLRDRLRENEVAKAQFMLVFDEYLYGPRATQWWVDFARMDRARI